MTPLIVSEDERARDLRQPALAPAPVALARAHDHATPSADLAAAQIARP